MRMRSVIMMIIMLLGTACMLTGCPGTSDSKSRTMVVIDQLGRRVEVPRELTRISAMHHFGGKIVYALGQQHRLVEQVLYGIEAQAMARVDPRFAALPMTLEGHAMNIEHLVALSPQCVFVYASDTSDMELLQNAGIPVIAVKGETLEESFAAVDLMARVLNCPEKGQAYIADCRRLLDLVHDRLKDIPPEQRRRVLFTGPKSIYTVATGQMLQSEILRRAAALNVAGSLRGNWADVSPEQVASWNPDVIFLGSKLGTYGVAEIYQNSQFTSLKAIRERRVYVFPSNIGWWDFPAPHCALGVVWTAKTLYPERFKDIDMRTVADDFYTKYTGHAFTAMGGRL